MGEAPRPLVRILRRSLIKPTAPPPEERVNLTAVDIMCRQMPHNRRVLFYRMAGPEEHPTLLQRLKESLAVALAHFYPLAGRLCQRDGERLHIDCSGQMGAEFVEAEVDDMSFEKLQQMDFEDTQPLFTELAPWIEPVDYRTACPLLIQISKFRCGSFALGLAHSHVVCDGTSLWHFMTSWAECVRGEPISLAPVHTRKLLHLQTPSLEQAFLRLESAEEEGLQHGGVDHKMSVFHFTKEMVSLLKQKGGKNTSSYEAVCAHLWRHTCLARHHEPDKVVSFIHVANMRQRLEPALPKGYFGNALLWATCLATAREIEEEEFTATVQRIRAALSSCDDAAFQGWLHWLEVHDRDEVFARCMLNGVRLRASSSPKFPVFEVDFGWGAPVAIRCPSVELPGKLIFFPGSEGIGSVDATLALPLPVMQRLENDSAFLHPQRESVRVLGS